MAIRSELNHRAQLLLKSLVEQYIQHGEPIGSKTLAHTAGMKISPASIRLSLAELEEAGYLHSPHTSAGRIPTEKGYRFLVDSLLTTEVAPSNHSPLLLDINPLEDTASILKAASYLLSDVTKLAGLVSLPKRNCVYLKHIEFLPLSEKRILVILVLNDHEIQNRIIAADRLYSQSELQQAANFLNEQYSGKDLSSIRRALLRSMKNDQRAINKFMSTAIKMASQALHEKKEDEYVMAGQSHLLGLVDNASGLDQLKLLFDAFAHKQAILHLIDKSLSAVSTQIFIGKESGNEAFKEVSIITAPYKLNEEVLGVLGVIGPIRMPYNRVISVVNMTAQLLNSVLVQK